VTDKLNVIDNCLMCYLNSKPIAAIRDKFKQLQLEHGAGLKADSTQRFQAQFAELNPGTNRKWPCTISV